VRSYCAIYVDVGYLISAAATRVTGTSLRGGVDIDYPVLIDNLIREVEQDSDLPLLRVNWYDSGGGRNGTADHVQWEIGLLPQVKLRLGRLSTSGEQKGVDLRIGLDLVGHARNNAVDQIYLVSGDDDLTEAVEEAQAMGVQVILLAVPGADGEPHGVARNLQRESDRLVVVSAALVDRAVTPAKRPIAMVVEPPRSEPVVAPDESKPSPSRMPPRRPSHPPVTPVAGTVTGLVYSSAGGLVPGAIVPGWDDDERTIDLEVVDDVCRSVLQAWRTTATPAEEAELRGGRPLIPADIDRALLQDLSARVRSYALSDSARYALRERFWLRLDD
jgi:uncharacterized LabA/DUF88 family protein